MYKLNHFIKSKFNGKNLVTTEHGSWTILSDEDLALLENFQVKEQTPLFRLLEDKGIIITDSNEYKIINSLRYKYHYLFNGTSLHIVVPTSRCNHKCIYCSANSYDENAKNLDMDKETAEKVVDFIFQSPAKAITIEFQGGEPLLNFGRVQDIINFAKAKNAEAKKDIRFALVSNLSKMDHDILKYLIKEKVGICTSLDGPKELHNKNRPWSGGNSYDKVTYWINEIKNHYNSDINALMVTTKFSLPYHKEIIDEYRKQKLKWIKIRFLDRLGNAKHKAADPIDYTTSEYIDFWKKSMEYLVEVNKSYDLREMMSHFILLKLNGRWANYTDFQSPCGAAIGQLAYAHDGSIHTCDEGRQYELFKLGNVLNNTYKEILTSGKTCSMVAASVNDTMLCDACAYKPFCGTCPVCNYAESGNLLPNLSKNRRCVIYKAMFEYYFSHLASETPTLHKQLFMKWVEESPLESDFNKETTK